MPSGDTVLAYQPGLERYLDGCYRESASFAETFGHATELRCMMQPSLERSKLAAHPHYRHGVRERGEVAVQPPPPASTATVRLSPSPDRNRVVRSASRQTQSLQAPLLTQSRPSQSSQTSQPQPKQPRQRLSTKRKNASPTKRKDATTSVTGAWWGGVDAQPTPAVVTATTSAQRSHTTPDVHTPERTHPTTYAELHQPQHQRRLSPERRYQSHGHHRYEVYPEASYTSVSSQRSVRAPAVQSHMSDIPDVNQTVILPSQASSYLTSAGSTSLEDANAQLGEAIGMLDSAEHARRAHRSVQGTPNRDSSLLRRNETRGVSFADETHIVEPGQQTGGDLDAVEHLSGLGILDALKRNNQYASFVEDWEGGHFDASDVGDVARRMTFGEGVQWKKVEAGGGYQQPRGDRSFVDGLSFRGLNDSYSKRQEARSQLGLFNETGDLSHSTLRSTSAPTGGPLAATYNPSRLHQLAQPRKLKDQPSPSKRRQKMLPGPWRGKPPKPWE